MLFDFADIEAYDPNGNYFWDQAMYDNLAYSGGNWGLEWIAANGGSELEQLTTGDGITDYGGCQGCAHSDSPQEANLNCVLKGRAVWWMMARLAGWDGGQTEQPVCGDVTGAGAVNTVDLMLLLQYCVNPADNPPSHDCADDIDGNRHINSLDVLLLMGYISNPTGYSLHCGCGEE